MSCARAPAGSRDPRVMSSRTHAARSGACARDGPVSHLHHLSEPLHPLPQPIQPLAAGHHRLHGLAHLVAVHGAQARLLHEVREVCVGICTAQVGRRGPGPLEGAHARRKRRECCAKHEARPTAGSHDVAVLEPVLSVVSEFRVSPVAASGSGGGASRQHNLESE